MDHGLYMNIRLGVADVQELSAICACLLFSCLVFPSGLVIFISWDPPPMLMLLFFWGVCEYGSLIRSLLPLNIMNGQHVGVLIQQPFNYSSRGQRQNARLSMRSFTLRLLLLSLHPSIQSESCAVNRSVYMQSLERSAPATFLKGETPPGIGAGGVYDS